MSGYDEWLYRDQERDRLARQAEDRRSSGDRAAALRAARARAAEARTR